MAEKRSIPTALGILIGPATAYLSYHIFSTSIHELAQILCLVSFLLVGHDLAKGGLSLSGILFVVFAPVLPIALYLRTSSPDPDAYLNSITLMALWLFSTLIGAIIAGMRPEQKNNHHLSRLAAQATLLVVIIVTSLYTW